MAGLAKSGSRADTQQLPTPQLGSFRKENAGASRAGTQFSRSPPGPRAGTSEVGLESSGPAPAAPQLARASPRVLLVAVAFYLLLFFIAIEIKFPLGAIETSGRL